MFPIPSRSATGLLPIFGIYQAPLKNQQALILLFIANAISGFAQGLSMLAIPWYFAQQNNSSQFNLIFGIVTFANIFWGLYAGTLVDRFPRKSLFLGTNLIEGSVLLSVALIGWSMGSLPLALIILAFTITVFGYRIHYPNLYAFAQEITAPEHYTRVTSYIEIVGQSTNVIAGALAVVLLEGLKFQLTTFLGVINIDIEAWKIYEIFTLDAITYFISVVLIIFIRYIPDKKFEVDRGALWQRLNSGFKWLRDHPMVFTFGFFTHSIFVVMLVSLFAVMPLYITNYLESGGEVFGTMEVLYGLGALMAGIFISRWTHRLSKVGTIIWLMFLTTAMLLLCTFTRLIPIYFVVGFVIGFANAGTRVLRVSYLFNRIPNHIIGRVNSVFSVTNILMRTFFVMIFALSFFNQGINIIYAYVILAAFTFLSGLVLYFNYGNLARESTA